MKKSLDIRIHILLLRIVGNKELKSESDNILGPNKKGKKQSEREKLIIEINC